MVASSANVNNIMTHMDANVSCRNNDVAINVGFPSRSRYRNHITQAGTRSMLMIRRLMIYAFEMLLVVEEI